MVIFAVFLFWACTLHALLEAFDQIDPIEEL